MSAGTRRGAAVQRRRDSDVQLTEELPVTADENVCTSDTPAGYRCLEKRVLRAVEKEK